MESNIRFVTEEMKNYFLQITRDVNDNASLTTIQNKEYQNSIIKKYKAKGITYFISVNGDDRNYSRICFQSVPWYISDVGTIVDVAETGALPISIYIDDNISVDYDPRKLDERDSNMWSYMKNGEFIHLKKGSEYKFRGRILFCDYYYNAKPKGRFAFRIISMEGAVTQFLRSLLR